MYNLTINKIFNYLSYTNKTIGNSTGGSGWYRIISFAHYVPNETIDLSLMDFNLLISNTYSYTSPSTINLSFICNAYAWQIFNNYAYLPANNKYGVLKARWTRISDASVSRAQYIDIYISGQYTSAYPQAFDTWFFNLQNNRTHSYRGIYPIFVDDIRYLGNTDDIPEGETLLNMNTFTTKEKS